MKAKPPAIQIRDIYNISSSKQHLP